MGKRRPDPLGDRCKALEEPETSRELDPSLVTLARLDGRAFHTLTRGLGRPYDARLSLCMTEVTRWLVEDFHASFGYTQSDEVTLGWEGRPTFTRVHKLTSVLAGSASARLADLLREHVPEKSARGACFDCRVWQVPTRFDAVDALRWRENDAVRNSLTMAAQSYYSHRELDGVGSAEKLQLLRRVGVEWDDYPPHFKRGVYVKRALKEHYLSVEEWMEIPERHRPDFFRPVLRSFVDVVDAEPIGRMADPDVFLFGEREPAEEIREGAA